MKVLILAALLVAAISARPGRSNNDDTENQWQWPWQVGKLYKYEVQSHTLARLQEGASTGSAIKAIFVLRAKAPGLLQARLEGVQHAKFHQELTNNRALPEELPYKPFQKLEDPFEITVEGGRILTLNVPNSLSISNQNLLKGLVSSLQVDLSSYRSVHNSHNYFDRETFQGQFNKKETDVTGDCETLYTVLPLASEWRRELPKFTDIEEPVEVTKTRNFGKCAHRVAYHFGVPEGAEWTGTARDHRENQFMKRSTDTRIIAGKQGPIYKVETTDSVYVSPQMYGKQKAAVVSYVKLNLVSVQQDNEDAWNIQENLRLINNLLYSLTSTTVSIDDSSNSVVDSRRNQKSQNVANQKDSNESGSLDSRDESDSFVNDDIVNINEPGKVALHMDPDSEENTNSPVTVQKLVQEIAQQLQNPNNMPKADALSKFNILVRFISSMSSDQLRQTSRSIEIAKSSNNIVKADMWMVYRDAVTQAGTMAAYQQIQSWIQSKKLQGEEAAQVLATLATTLRYPTKELMNQFFNLAMSAEVQQQAHLNSTAVISATRFIHMAQVDNGTASSYYPTHMYGRLSHQQDNFVRNEILPRLSEEMRNGIQQGNSHKAQVYIKAIGNVGHRAILDIFAPYLQGDIPVTTYLRRLMIENLKVLAHHKDHYARAVLYSLLRNTAEPYEIRVTAIQNIFMSQPTTPMMQAMAQMTNKDPSIHVRAALTSAIKSAAQLKNPRYWELAKTAEAAKEILTKEDFGVYYSKKEFIDFFDAEQDLGVLNILSYISSDDSLLPKSMKYSWKSRAQGLANKNTISASFSSVRQFFEHFQEQMNIKKKEDKKESNLNQKYSAEKIAEMLNIKRERNSPLEAAFNMELLNQQRFFALGEDDMQQLSQAFRNKLMELNKGVDYHYTKVLSPSKVVVMFPVAMGVPFIYKYKEPTLIHIQGKAKALIQFPSNENRDHASSIEKEIQFTFARNIEGSVGFLDTISDQYASAGVVSKLQVNIPIKAQMQIQSGKVRVHLEPIRPEQDTTLVHVSVWPYTANQHKDSHVTISQDPTTKVISRPNKVSSMDTKFGQAATGMQFQLQGYSYSSDYRNLATMFRDRDVLSNVVFATYQRDVALTHYNLRYLGKQSQNKAVTVTAVYGKYYNQKNDVADTLKPTNVNDVTPDSEDRRQEMLNRVSSGINGAKVQVVDISATFEGSQKSDYMLTAAIGDNEMSPKIQYALFAGRNNVKIGNNQVNAVGTVNKPTVSSMNFLEALKKDLKTNFNLDIKFGQNDNGKISIGGFMERTKKYAEALEKLPLAKQCLQEMTKNNFYQPACHEVIVLAHAPDYLKAAVTYKDVSPMFKNITHQVYRLLRHLDFWYTEENVLRNAADGKVEIEVDMSYLERTLSLLVNSRAGDLRVTNVPVPRVTPAALAIYSPIRMNERLANVYSGHQFLPYCTVDGNRIKTFSNRTYDYTLSRSWHVLIQDDAKFAGKYNHNTEQLVVLARNPSEKQREIYVSYSSQNGKNFEIDMKPAPEGSDKKAIINVASKLKQTAEGDLVIYWDEEKEMPLLKYYPLSDGVVMINIEEDRIRMMYDGERLVILTDENRNNTRGICGYMSSDVRDDYMTPTGIVDSPAHFAASFALNQENGEPQTQQLQQEARELSYQRKQWDTAILNSGSQWQQSLKRRNTRNF